MHSFIRVILILFILSPLLSHAAEPSDALQPDNPTASLKARVAILEQQEKRHQEKIAVLENELMEVGIRDQARLLKRLLDQDTLSTENAELHKENERLREALAQSRAEFQTARKVAQRQADQLQELRLANNALRDDLRDDSTDVDH